MVSVRMFLMKWYAVHITLPNLILWCKRLWKRVLNMRNAELLRTRLSLVCIGSMPLELYIFTWPSSAQTVHYGNLITQYYRMTYHIWCELRDGYRVGHCNISRIIARIPTRYRFYHTIWFIRSLHLVWVIMFLQFSPITQWVEFTHPLWCSRQRMYIFWDML